ncbi:MAG: hypothetical protein ACOYXW_04845, partial [Actinomycetota bacterium]
MPEMTWPVVAGALALVIAGPAAASTDPDFDFGGGVSDDAFVVDGQQQGATDASDGASPAREGGPRYVFTRVPACEGNFPGEGGGDVQCAAAADLCPQPGEIMFW